MSRRALFEEVESAARLHARPGTPARSGEPGVQRLRFSDKREALLYVPEAAIGRQSPLAVMLHGAGGNAEQGLHLLSEYADDAGLMLLAPESRRASWDLISDSQYGPDVRLIDEALGRVFSLYAIDEKQIALGGFSDGASYALSLGHQQRLPLRVHPRIFTRLHDTRALGRPAASIRLTWNPRRGASNRSM